MKTLKNILNEAKLLKSEFGCDEFYQFYKEAVRKNGENKKDLLNYYVSKCNRSNFESPLWVLACWELINTKEIEK